MAYTTATLTGTYLKLDGSPAEGTVDIIPNSRALIDSEGNVILSGRRTVTLDEDGSFSVVLPSTDDATIEPALNRQYTVSAKPRHTRNIPAVEGIDLPGGTTRDMADITSATAVVPAVSGGPSGAAFLLLQESLASEVTRAQAAEATKVNSSTYTAGLAAKADASALTTETTRATAAETALRTGTDATFEARLTAAFGPESEQMQAAFVSASGTSGLHVDGSRVVNAAQRMKQETVAVGITGDLILTLGAAPIDGQVAVWVKTGSNAPARLLPSSYTVASNVVVIPALLSGDTVLIEYMYDSDVTAMPAAAASNQYTIYDNYERADSSTTPGNAITGQAPNAGNSSVWGITSGNLRRVTAGTNSGAGDVFFYNSTATWGTYDTVFTVHPGGTYGLAFHVSAGTDQIYLSDVGLFRRQAGTNAPRLAAFSQTFVTGDAQCVMIDSDSETIRVYRRAGNVGPWVLVLGPIVESYNKTALGCGIRVSTGDSTNAGRVAHFRHRAGATTLPVAA